MKSRKRVQKTFDHEQPDFTPCDYFGTPEIEQALFKHFNVATLSDLRDCLNTDIRYIDPPYIGPELKHYDDGSRIDIWGVIRKPMPNEYGEYAEPINLPFAKWTTVEEAQKHPWPSPDWYDYDALSQMCEKYPDHAIGLGKGFGIQDFINGISFGRGVEQVLMDIAIEEPVYFYILEKRHRFYMDYVERSLQATQRRVDLVLCGDDFGQQQGPLISPETFDKIFAPKKKEFFDMVHSYGAKIVHHSCGSTRKLIPRFIKIGMDALQTIQPQAKDMNPYALKAEFGKDIVFHGAVDVQGWLQCSTVEQIKTEVNRLMDNMGKDGGYVLSPSHNIQPDTPIQNVLAVYETVAERRGILSW